MLDPTLLRSFIAVAQTRSFTAAGSRLGLRQSTVSGHVRKLEEDCGKRLFIRDTHRVTMTGHGEAMLGFARSIMETSERAQRHFARGEVRGRVRFGASEDVVLRGLPQILRQFMRDHPQVELELTVGLSGTLHERLEADALDLVFVKRRPGELHGTLIWREPLVWFSAPGLRLDPSQPVPLILLAQPSITRAQALEALEMHGRAWRVVCTSSSQSGVHAAALAGLGIGPHARSLVPPGLAALPALPHLPAPGDVEFVLLEGRRAQSAGPALALAEVIQSNGDLLRGPNGEGRTKLGQV
ncbi:MAG TPA: LysR substrate-binding domain-containing protein [Acetobacteraceae bacterium]|jgi:DNA-binding transcriptional LysR family regulator